MTNDHIVEAFLANGKITLDLVWALEWINTLTDRLTGDHMVDEFLKDLAARRLDSEQLDACASEVRL
jgi:hypothetical protein